MNHTLLCGRFEWQVNQPKVMGIVNVTPDSFSDGGRFDLAEDAFKHAQKLVEEGVDILDIGGESTRPNAPFVSPEEEWQRVAPVLEAVYSLGVPVSLDTRRTEVMKKALQAGWVDLINDVSALEDAGALDVMTQYPRVAICLMHKQGDPHNMQHAPQYKDVVAEVTEYLKQRINLCLNKGIERNRLMADPGYGFGKTLEHNIELLKHQDKLVHDCQVPVLVGLSRKKSLGDIVGEMVPDQRRGASVAAALAAIARGAHIVRVHDVKDTVQAVKIWQKVGVFI